MLNTLYIGIGQCGNRFADCFARYSTEKTELREGRAGVAAVAINTAAGDMSILENIPQENRVKITLNNHLDGAGRDPEVGRRSMEEHLAEVDNCIAMACSRAQMEHIDLCFLWAGLGGGTGTGGLLVLAEHLVEQGYDIAIGVTLPTKAEGFIARGNAYNAMLNLQDWIKQKNRRNIPYIVVDNSRITDMTLEMSNEIIASNIVRLNKATSYELTGSNFDDTDFKNVLKKYGVMAVGKASIPITALTGGNETVLMDALLADLTNSPFAEFSVDDSRSSSVIVVAPRKFLKGMGSDNRKILDKNISAITNRLAGSNPHQGVFLQPSKNVTDKVYVYVLLTGLPFPFEKVNEIGTEVAEYIRLDKEKNKRNLNAAKGMTRLSFGSDSDEDDEEDDEDVVSALTPLQKGKYDFAVA